LAEASSAIDAIPVTDPEPPFYRAPLEFIIHTLVGALIFAIVTLPAVGLDVFTRSLEAKHVSIVITEGVHVAEYCLFGSDLLLFLVFLVKTCWRVGKKL
jgi:hypothetical protein